MKNPQLSVKGFIVNEKGELLIVRRSKSEKHFPNAWEIPGGRLDVGEDPFDGLTREVKEEVGIDVDVLNPIKVSHFKRQDGQQITMIVFACKPWSDKVSLGKEHTAYEWIPLGKAATKLIPEFHPELELFNRFFKDKI